MSTCAVSRARNSPGGVQQRHGLSLTTPFWSWLEGTGFFVSPFGRLQARQGRTVLVSVSVLVLVVLQVY